MPKFAAINQAYLALHLLIVEPDADGHQSSTAPATPVTRLLPEVQRQLETLPDFIDIPDEEQEDPDVVYYWLCR